MILRSSDGLRWQVDTAGYVLGAGRGSRGVVSQAGEVAAVVRTNQTLDRESMYRLRRDAWLPVSDPRPDDDQAVWTINGMARSRQGWVAASSRSLDNAQSSQLWLSRTPRSLDLARVAAPPPPRQQAVVAPFEIARWSGAWRAIGEANDRRAVWSQTDDRGFGTPQALDLSAATNIHGLVTDEQSLPAYGSTTGGNASHATVWRSTDAKKFAASPRDTFEKVTLYSSSSIASLRRYGKLRIAVGDRTSNGDLNASALVYTSIDGRRWTAGEADRILTYHGGEAWEDVTDLAGDHDRKRSMRDVTQTSQEYLAVGSSEENGPSQATIWHSTTSRNWRSEVIGAKGFERSAVSSAATIGDRTVLYGWAGRRGETDTTPYVWTSGDRGVSWRGRAVGRPGEDADFLVATDTHFVITGATNEEVPHPWLLQSVDGASWRPLGLSGYPPAADRQTWLSDVEAEGSDLVLLIKTVAGTTARSAWVRQTVG